MILGSWGPYAMVYTCSVFGVGVAGYMVSVGRKLGYLRILLPNSNAVEME